MKHPQPTRASACAASPRATARTMAIVGLLASTVSVTVAHAAGVVVGNSGGNVYWSDDFGAHWQQGQGISHVTAMDFIDGDRGWASDGLFLYKTTDGGAHWSSTNPSQRILQTDSIVALDYQGGPSAWAGSNSGLLLRTDDGGQSWNLVYDFSALTGGNDVRSLRFLDANTGWIGLRSGVYGTTNGGQSWTQYATLASTGGSDWVSNSVGVAAGSSAKWTSNGGATWNNSTNGSLLLQFDFVGATEVWGVGVGGAIRHSTNAGHTWVNQASGTTASLNGVSFRDALEGWVTSSNGTVRYTIDGGNTWLSAGAPANALSRGMLFTTNVTSTAPVPEPEGYALLLAGLGCLGLVRRKKTACRATAD